MSNKKWIKRPYSSIEETIEANTGISIDELLNPAPNPYLEGLAESVAIVRACIEADMQIKIVGDYDVDGITASTILALGLEELTGKKPDVIIPKRFSEGYGLNMSIVDSITEGLMITVDNGIAAEKQIKRAKEKGITVVIIDHHVIPDDGVLPDADAILDPHAISGSEYLDYSGAGLAYRFIMQLNPNTQIEDKLVALAGIATVADVMQLKGDNRRLVLKSLQAVKSGNVTYGLQALLRAIQIPIEPTATDYGFKVGPCINASGRLYDDGGYQVYDLISMDAKNICELLDIENICKEKADNLVAYNRERKSLVNETMEKVNEDLDEKTIKKPLIYYRNDIHEGIIGIIAGRLCEKYHTPALVFTDPKEEGVLKGSGRSIPEVNLKKLLDSKSDLFIKYGGHAGAAGMSIKKDNLNNLEAELVSLLKEVDITPSNVIYYDLDINEEDIPRVAEELKKYEPFGEGCPKIRFRLNNFTASPCGAAHYTVMGPFKNHIKIFGKNISLMGYEMINEYIDAGEPTSIDVICELGINYFNGKVSYVAEIIDFKAKEAKKTNFYNNLTEMLVFN